MQSWLRLEISGVSGAMASSLDADAEELLGRDLSGLRMPYIWLDATYVKCRTGSHVASVLAPS